MGFIIGVRSFFFAGLGQMLHACIMLLLFLCHTAICKPDLLEFWHTGEVFDVKTLQYAFLTWPSIRSLCVPEEVNVFIAFLLYVVKLHSPTRITIPWHKVEIYHIQILEPYFPTGLSMRSPVSTNSDHYKQAVHQGLTLPCSILWVVCFALPLNISKALPI